MMHGLPLDLTAPSFLCLVGMVSSCLWAMGNYCHLNKMTDMSFTSSAGVGVGGSGGGGVRGEVGGPQRLTVTLPGRHCRTQHSKCSPKDTERHPVEEVF